jgi:hypothetical protein
VLEKDITMTNIDNNCHLCHNYGESIWKHRQKDTPWPAR